MRALHAASHAPGSEYWCGREEHPAASPTISAARKIGFPGTALPLGGGNRRACLCPSKGEVRQLAFLLMGMRSMLFCHSPQALCWEGAGLICNSLLAELGGEQLSCSVACSSKGGHSRQAGSACQQGQQGQAPRSFTIRAKVCRRC